MYESQKKKKTKKIELSYGLFVGISSLLRGFLKTRQLTINSTCLTFVTHTYIYTYTNTYIHVLFSLVHMRTYIFCVQPLC